MAPQTIEAALAEIAAREAKGQRLLQDEVVEPQVAASEDIPLAALHKWDKFPGAEEPFGVEKFRRLAPPDREHAFSRWASRRFARRSSSLWPRDVLDALPSLELWDSFLRQLPAAPDVWSALDADWSRMLSRAATLRFRPAYARGRRVLIFDPVFLASSDERHMIIDGMDANAVTVLGLHEQLPRLGRELGLQMHALAVLPDQMGISYLKAHYDRVFVVQRRNCLQAAARWHDAMNPRLARGAQPYYDAVLTWNPYRIPMSKSLALELGARALPLGRHLFHEGTKFKIRDVLIAEKSFGSTPYFNIQKEADLMRVVQLSGTWSPHQKSESPCFPCFMKPIGGGGMSAGINTHLLSGKIDDVMQLFRQARRLHKEAPHNSLILERYLAGAEVFAETLVHRGSVLRCSFRAIKWIGGRYGNPYGNSSMWQWPAVLTREEFQQCTRVVYESTAALELQNGVFGFQLTLDPGLGCTFLELNTRPHMWPMLFDPLVQLYFTDVWLYPIAALLLAMDAPKESINSVLSPSNMSARLALTAVCSGPAADQQLFYREWLMWMTEVGGCTTKVSSYVPHTYEPPSN